MKQYEINRMRTVAVVGHSGTGKTSFVESALFLSGTKAKKGTIETKSTTSDYLAEEHNKLASFSTSLIPIEFKDYKFNFLDTPGSEEFVNELYQSLDVVKGAVLVIDGTKAIDIGSERVLTELNERHIPTIIYVNKMDKPNVKFEKILESIQSVIGYQAVPFLWPVVEGEDFKGYVNLVDMNQKLHEDGSSQILELDEAMVAQVEPFRTKIVESVAETSEELFDKHFAGEKISQEEIYNGLRKGVLDGDLKPIVFGSADLNIGVNACLDIIKNFMPAPDDLKPVTGLRPDSDIVVERISSNDEPLSAYVFKTTVDPFMGSISLIKVFSGVLKSGAEVLVPNINKTVKIGNLFTLRGKEQIEMDTIYAGDIGAVAKIENLFTGATLTDPKNPVIFEASKIQTPTMYIGIHPKNKNDDNKLSSVLAKMKTEDPTIDVVRNPETAQLLIGGQGLTHIGFITDKMKNSYGLEVETSDQKIVYRETIKAKGDAEGKHKKQSGGSGQFGVVKMRFEPLNPNEKEFEFAEEVHGGSVPKNYFPAVEKGLIETFQKGPLAGFPVIGIKAILYDGQYHDVDSNEISFKMAASLAFKNALDQVKPTILEPVMSLKITVKDDYVGDVMGDANKRRGRVLGMEPLEGGRQVISAEIPEVEIVKYTVDLKAMTQGSGSFTRTFARYEEVPDMLIDRIVQDHTVSE
jgi:elongation factor G